MRKISKNRTDDDVVSSTNGSASVGNEESQESEQGKKQANNEDNENYKDKNKSEDDKDSSSVKGTPKKSKSKQSKKKKSEKVNKKDAEEEYEVEKILDSKKIKGKLHYLIRWKGYSADSDSWEPSNTLSCPDLIIKYNEEKENSKNSPSKKANKRKGAKKESKSPPKKSKTSWDSENADEDAEYEVERILEVHHKKNGSRDFLIHWKGWSSKFDSWEPEANLNCPDLIKRFMEKVENAKTTESRNLRVAPETTNRFTLQDPTSGRRLSKRRGQRQR
ncbi:hypothetical protein KGM_213507 [Danaus plexippus plexippus]|uniref:Chromo domain-containing protein n=2 Tax=Danaus plexippus TaxID=13037 RepID=A0A212FJK7_DANPL|nr:hypothetical protein KGM_213507 [Danaus plexippus plexippus]